MISTREAFGCSLATLGEQYDFYVLDADLAKATMTIEFKKQFPERHIDMGIAEANMMGYAAGLASCGIPVFASSFAAFAAGRAYDQVRNGIVYPRLNVKIGATHGGVMIGADGGSHQCIEDLALIRVIPGMVVLHPSDEISTFACVKESLFYDGPVYMRFGRFATPTIYEQNEEFPIGGSKVIRDGDDAVLFSAGTIIHEALTASKRLGEEGIHLAVVDLYSVSPIDSETIIKYAKRTKKVVTLEDHSINGGLGGAVCEVLAETYPVRVKRLGIQGKFGQSGTPDELKKIYGIDADTIIFSVKEMMHCT